MIRFFCWLLRHPRRTWVGAVDVADIWVKHSNESFSRCPHGRIGKDNCDPCSTHVQVLRWACRCGAMGERWIRRGTGVYKVHFGELVPDDKRWANPNLEEAK